MTATAHARHTDPATSHEAAATVKVTRNRLALLTFIKTSMPPQFTDKQLVAAYTKAQGRPGVPEQAESGIRTRRKELADAKLLHTIGTVRNGRRPEQLWEVNA